MSTLTEQVANLVTSTDNLTSEVIGKLGQINSELDAKKAEIDAYWVSKSSQIDTDWNNKEIEINQRLEDFDNLVFYAKPVQTGTGDGLSLANATTLQNIIDNKLVNSVVNKVFLAPGLHVLNSGTTVENYYLVQFLPQGTYNSLNPPTIITQSTTDADISRDEIGNPSPSQVCTAHDSDEYPLLIKNSTVVIENISFRGTRYALRLEKSTAMISGEIKLDVWVFSISCTAHRGVGLYCVDSKVYGSDQWKINIYHPDYTACSDVLNSYAAPVVCERSELFLHGRLEWKGNIPIAELPTENVANYRATVDSSPRTCINARDKSYIRVQNLAYKACAQLFYSDNQSIIDIQYLEAIVGTEPVMWLGQTVNHSKLFLSNQFANWPSDAQKKVKIGLTGNVTEKASLIANEKSEIYLDGIEIIATCACSTFAVLDKDSDFYAKNSTISADNRNGNLGFFKILQNYNSKAFLKNSSLSTRAGDNDTAITTETGMTISASNTITSTTKHRESSFGRYIENGIVYGNVAFNEDTHLTVPSVDFPTLQDAISFLNDKICPNNVTVIIDISAGIYNYSSVIGVYTKNKLWIKGATPIEKSVVGLISTAGSSGNYDVVLQLNNVTNLIQDTYINIESDGAGGGSGTGLVGTGSYNALAGCHKIKSISGNNITINVTYQGTLPAMTVTGGKVVYYPTQINFSSTTGLWLETNYATIENLCFVGNKNYGHWLVSAAIAAKSPSNVYINRIGIAKFQKGILADSLAHVYINWGCFSDNLVGVHGVYNGIIKSYICSFNGNSQGGILASHHGIVSAYYFIAFGNGIQDILAHNSGTVDVGTYAATNLSPVLNTVGNGNSVVSNYTTPGTMFIG